MGNYKKAYKIMAQRFVVQVLNNNMPMLDEDETGLTEEQIDGIMKEYKAITERLRKVAVKNGGSFGQYGG